MRQIVAARVRQAMALLCIFFLTYTTGAGPASATVRPLQDPSETAQDPAPAPSPDAQQTQGQDAPPQQQPDAPQLTPEQLNDLVTPIALYADPLIAQILAASTYPLEVVQADRWLQSNSNLTGTALTQAAQQQNWDPSVQALVVFPSVLSMMDKNLTWTTDLGNAFLAQQQDVMDAVQRMRQKAYASGKLQSNSQQTVAQTTDNGTQAITIEPPSPNVIYVPVYDPVAIWGPPVWYPWGPFWYPPRPRFGFVGGGVYGGFFIGVSIGGFFPHWGGWGGWGWGCGWGHRNVYINNNFYVVNHYRVPGGVYRSGASVWAHNPAHRMGVPYPNRSVANRVGYRGPGGRPIGRPVGAPGYRPGARPPEGRPGVQPRPGGPGGQNRPGTSNRPGYNNRPPDRSALGGVQNTPGERAQMDRARGYSSMGNRGQTPRPTNSRPPSAPRSEGRPSGGRPHG